MKILEFIKPLHTESLSALLKKLEIDDCIKISQINQELPETEYLFPEKLLDSDEKDSYWKTLMKQEKENNHRYAVQIRGESDNKYLLIRRIN